MAASLVPTSLFANDIAQTVTPSMISDPIHLLTRLLEKRLPAEEYRWLQGRLALVQQDDSTRHIHISFGLIPRRLGKQDLNASEEELDQAHARVTGWRLDHWSIDMTARILLLCSVAHHGRHSFGSLFRSMCQTADLGESLALYSGTALLPPSDELDRQIGEGLRTHVRAIFEAIAHRNPYPAAHFSELRWNHMVLKALFVDSTLHPIQGLDERANAELARILCDYAHERWAASRPVTPELWRCVGPFAEGRLLDDLMRALQSTDMAEQKGAALALSTCPDPLARDMLAKRPALVQAINDGTLSWDSLNLELNPANDR